MWNKGFRTVGLVTASAVLAAGCAASGGTSITITSRLAIEHGRDALEAARHHAGTHDVTAEQVVEAFPEVIAHDSLKDWWRATVVGDMAQISFLTISEEYKKSHPDVTYPLVKPSEKSGESVSHASETTPVEIDAPSGGTESPTTTTEPAEQAGAAEQGSSDSHGGADEHGSPTEKGAPEVTIESQPAHGEATPQSDAGHLPENAFSVAIAACVLPIQGEMRVRSGACPAESTEAHAAETHAGPHWSYDGELGQKAWGSLSEEYAVCSSGREQSPINLTGATKAPLGETKVNYTATEGVSSDNGHTTKVSFAVGSSVEINKTLYRLVEVHFHAHSEHTVNGKAYPAEIHFVHKDQNDKLAVIGVLLEEGAGDPVWAPLISGMIHAPKTGEKAVGKLNLQQMMPAAPEVYRYKGSLTTPPCSEGVTWSVLTEPVSVTSKQLGRLAKRYGANARDTQPLNERQLILDAEAG